MLRTGLGLLIAALFWTSATAHAAPPAPGLHQGETITVNGQVRDFSYYAPGKAEGRQLPLVIYLHGHGDNMRHMVGKGLEASPAARWMKTAEREKFLVFYPLGLKGADGKTGWNDCRRDVGNPETDDIAFVKALIELAARDMNLDRSRVYVTGMSNGGHMAMRIATEMSDQVAAASSIVALAPKDSACKAPQRPVPILFMHGTDDPIAPFNGGEMAGERGAVYSARETVDLWRKWNGVEDVQETSRQLPDRDRSDKSVIVERAWAAPGPNAVVAFEMKGAGHTEPSRGERLSRLISMVQGRQNRDIEMADTVWEFFRSYRTPTAR